MTGYSGSQKDMYFITDFVSTDLTNFTRMLVSTYNGLGQHHITHGDTSCGYACSDHASWTRNGVPSAFPFEALFNDYNPHIHSSEDLLNKLDTTGEKQAKFTKLGIEFAMELAKANTGPSVPPDSSANISFVWANKPRQSSYTPSKTYSHNAAGGKIGIRRLSTGHYSVSFVDLGREKPGANVQVTGYGLSANDCKVRSWKSTKPDFVINVDCLKPNGTPVDDRYTVLVTWP